MPKKYNSDLIRLQDILKAIDDIEGFNRRSSLADPMAVMAISYEIAIIGEACAKLSELLRSNNPHIPWSDIIGMRHRIIHDYGKVSIARLKEVVESHLAPLKSEIEKIIIGLSTN